MLFVEGEQYIDLRFSGTGRDDCVVSLASGNVSIGGPSKQNSISRRTKSDDLHALQEIRFQQTPGVNGGDSVRSRKSGQDSVRFNQSRTSYNHSLLTTQTILDFPAGSFVVVVPRTDGRNHAACIRQERRHSQCPRSWWSLRRVSSTIPVVSGGTGFRGTATSKRPRRFSWTSSGAGSISMRPSRVRTSRDIPGLMPASRRISIGMTRRPAESMVVFMP